MQRFHSHAPADCTQSGGRTPSKWKKAASETKAFTAAIYIVGWYTLSIFLSMYNKWLLSSDYHGFGYPLFTTGVHMIVQSGLSFLMLNTCLPNYKPSKAPSPWLFMTRVMPCGMATGIDIGLSATSLTQISVSFYTMVKSSAPVFVLIFAVLFGLERPTCGLVASVLVIVLGVVLMISDGEGGSSGTNMFNWSGFVQVQAATVASGFRWALTQILLSRAEMGMNNPLATTVILAPVMAVSLLATCGLIEGFGTLFTSDFFSTFESGMAILGIISVGGIIAFGLTMVEYLLISTTSVLTFSVAGIVKEIITISVSMTVFGDRFTFMNVVGLVTSILGIMGYNMLRISASPTSMEKHTSSIELYSAVHNDDDSNDAHYIHVDDEN
ncbi:hypothetical protein SeLEV6574_g07071 [Synchytrium endobioticum]|nr:hypothetical protein SeLEV6574_g07071 [Synchytrium endobioticum]